MNKDNSYEQMKESSHNSDTINVIKHKKKKPTSFNEIKLNKHKIPKYILIFLIITIILILTYISYSKSKTISTIESEIASMTADIKTLNSKISENESLIVYLQQGNDGLSTSNDEQISKNNKLRELNEQIQSSINYNNNQIDKLTKESNLLRDEYSILSADESRLNQRITALQNEINSLNKQISSSITLLNKFN